MANKGGDPQKLLPGVPRAKKELQPKTWVEQVTVTATMHLQRKVINFLLWTYVCLLAATLLVFFFQGFRFCGFYLQPSLLQWLGGATIGEIGGLLLLTFKAVFAVKKESKY